MVFVKMESRRGKRRGRRKNWNLTKAAVGKLENLLKCTLCSNLLNDPCVVGSCEHMFCKNCVQGYSGKHCPECNIPIISKDMQHDGLISNVVSYTSQLGNIFDDTESNSTVKDHSSDIGSDSNDESIVHNVSERKRGSSSKASNDATTPTTSTRSKRKLRPNLTSSPVSNAKVATTASPGLRLKRNIKGETPLHLAAIKGDVVNIRRLLHQGANPNEKDNAGWTPLHEACHHGHTKIAEILIEKGAFIDVPACDNETPLHDAVSMEQVEIVALLVSRGANVNARNSRGLIPGDLSKSEETKLALKTTKVPVINTAQTSNSSAPSNQTDNIILLATGLNEEQQNELDKCAKILKAVVVVEFYEDVTHVIADCDDKGHCQRTVKFMMALLTGKWILNYNWVEECMAFQRIVFEEPYEVIGNKKQQSTFGPRRARLNTAQQFPPLFDGCSFFFHGNFMSPSPNKDTLSTLVKHGGGMLMNREPRHQLNGLVSIPYHAPKDNNGAMCSTNQFIIYQEFLPQRLKNMRDESIRCETFSWLLNCISAFELLPTSNKTL